MKKFLSLLMILVMCALLISCYEDTSSNDSTANEDDVIIDQEQIVPEEEEEAEIEIKIDAIAESLGLTDESEVLYGLIGAVAGKQYRNGNVELYQFDANSTAYKKLIERKTYLIPAAYKDGVVLIFALGVEEDPQLIEAFNNLDF